MIAALSSRPSPAFKALGAQGFGGSFQGQLKPAMNQGISNRILDRQNLRASTTTRALPEIAAEQAALVHSLNDWMCDAIVASLAGGALDVATTVIAKNKTLGEERDKACAVIVGVAGAIGLANAMYAPTSNMIQAFQTRDNAKAKVLEQKEQALHEKIASVQFPKEVLERV